MPAPLARGLIISLSLLFAAGLAVYENPQVRAFIDEHRRKIAVALQDFGDNISDPQQQRQRNQSRSTRRASEKHDASSYEEESPEAAERRRRATEEILERRRVLEEKRGVRSARVKRRGSSFDDLVDEKGNLMASASGTEMGEIDNGLRRRHAEAAGAAMGVAMANPFADEMGLSLEKEKPEMSDEDLAWQLQAQFDREHEELQVRSSGEAEAEQPLTQAEIARFEQLLREEMEEQGKDVPVAGDELNISDQELMLHLQQLQTGMDEHEQAELERQTPIADSVSSPASTHTMPHTPTSEREGVLVNTNDAASSHPSEALVELTPTTSAPGTPRQAPRQAIHQQSYQSIQDWAENSTTSFHSFEDSSEDGYMPSEDVSEIGSVMAASEAASDMDVVSEPGISTPGTWTEVGSVTSREGHEEQPL